MDDRINKNKSAEQDVPVMERRIGKTTYLLRVHFNPNSKDTLQSKLERLLANEVRHTDLMDLNNAEF